jgi:polyphenol oxidase
MSSRQEHTGGRDRDANPPAPSRRDVLGGAGLAVGALALPGVHAADARGADHARADAAGSTKATHFDFTNQPPRVRKSFYDLSEKEVRNFCDAVGYMRDGWRKGGKPLSLSSPVQWDNLVSTHAYHCTEADHGVLQVHWSWFFLPWHRAYLFIIERHLANVISEVFGQPADAAGFALPYWDWETHKGIPNTKIREGKQVPSPLFGFDLKSNFDPSGDGDPDSFNLALVDGYRGPSLESPDMDPAKEPTDGWKKYTKMIRDYHTSPDQISTILKLPFCVFGGMQHIDRSTGMGLLESSPHNTVHDWAGSRYGSNRDMGTLRYAAMDPVFYLHHGNVDRIWSLYPYTPDPDAPPAPPNNCEYTPAGLKAWGDQQFEFLDVGAKPVYITVRDTIKAKSGVTYAPPSRAPAFLATLPERKAVPKERSVVISRKEAELTDKAVSFSPEAGAALQADKPGGRPAKPAAAVLEIDVGDFYYSSRFRVEVYASAGAAVRNPPLDEKHFVGSFQVLDSHAGVAGGNATHTFFVNVSPGASNFFTVAPPGMPYTLTLVPKGSSSKDKKFFLKVTGIKLRVYE